MSSEPTHHDQWLPCPRRLVPRDKIVIQMLPMSSGVWHTATDHRITKCRKLRLRITQGQHGGGLPHRTARHPGSPDGVAGARRGQGLAHILRARASLGRLASGPRSADFLGGGSGATLSQEQAEQKASCECMWATGPKNGHYLNGIACTAVSPILPAFRLRGCRGKKGQWLLDQADRKAGKQVGEY